MKYVTAVSLVLIFLCTKTQGQSFSAAAPIPDVDEDGFYKIFISPKINIYLQNDFSDIRIYDQHNQEVPYLFQKSSRGFNDFRILIKKFELCCTLLMLHNVDKTTTNFIKLVIRNDVTAREATLLGSNDRQQWVTLKDWFKPSVSINEGLSEVKIVDIPVNNYEFFFLRFNDSTGAPLNVVRAGYDVADTERNLTEIPLKIQTSNNVKEKKTYVHLLFETPQFIDKVDIEVGGVKFFKRKATLSEKRIRKSKNGKLSEYYRLIQQFDLSSGQPPKLNLSGIRTKELRIVIENEDNPPLSISKLKTFQLHRYLVAWLNQGDEYTLKFGDKKLNAPIYDLSFFQDSIPDQLKVLEPTDVYSLEDGSGKPSRTFFTSKTIIWIAIIAIIIVLAFMSRRVISESAKADKKE